MKILEAHITDGYNLRLTYPDGQRDYDFTAYVNQPMYARYASPARFRKFRIAKNGMSLMWGDYDLIFQSAYLYAHGKTVRKSQGKAA